jgi:uncharacterized protein YndB with AHSA1/START domain
MRTDEPPVIVKVVFTAPAGKIWQAITSVDPMRRWYFDNIPAFEARVGFETQFTVINEDRQFPHLWRVVEVVPGKKIAYSWRFEGYPGAGMVSFDLEPHTDGTSLKVTNTVQEDFPDDVPEFRRESCLEGWRYLLGQSLKTYLGESVENKTSP